MSANAVRTPLIETERVGYRYRGGPTSAAAVRDVDVRVAAGDLLGLVGPNGAGKSTLLKLMAGLLVPTEGRVLLRGSPLGRLNRRRRARLIAYVPQQSMLDFDLSVSDVVAMGRFPHIRPLAMEREADRWAVRRALEETELTPLAHRSVTRLSGGERQRVLIARAVAQESPILLLDEPTAHLDIHHQSQLFTLLARLRSERRMTIVVIVHDLNLAAQHCDRLALLGDGRLLECGSPHDVVAPEALERAYGTSLSVTVTPHPHTGLPVVLPGPAATSHPIRANYAYGRTEAYR